MQESKMEFIHIQCTDPLAEVTTIIRIIVPNIARQKKVIPYHLTVPSWVDERTGLSTSLKSIFLRLPTVSYATKHCIYSAH